LIRGLLIVFQALLWLLVLRLLLRTLAGLFGARAAPASRPEPPRVKAGEELVLDRVCRTYVLRSRALAARVEGREEHFCSAACREQALAGIARAS
jgi:hypothetical protein